MRQRLTDLVDQLDEAGESEYLRLFSQARAASALSAAMDDDARKAALEGICEACHATDDKDTITQAIRAAAASEPVRHHE